MNKTIQERYFKKGQLLTIPKKEKNKLQILDIIIQRFKKNKIYTEKEVNENLQQMYDDFAILRRYLVDYDYLRRTNDGSQYTVNSDERPI
ncbi:DUF2087 domain-containing protein [Rummeliibacillus sp. G93]|uniref:DUF2087 domain-containing protein n=1 Tax=Rummeliibacillus TaxID=648802 RepID=UPI0011705CAB|nr:MULTISPECIES: DUF2087 domain-containing protein [Rummeliibacillus]MBB5169435.1 hypothetical protein [Rummeliibacillus stabekisii]UQW98803.1 DUF2087 domain-containing protein [Rummeliibacillus sp. G93]GEL03695.1 transcriptional regulator [Rummeliibacillus stabekisii]